jgi:hypothetical protein
MGAYKAARKYYLIAVALARTSAPCNGVFDLCDGFIFPRDIYPRLESVKTVIAQSEAAPAPLLPVASALQTEAPAPASQSRPAHSASRIPHATPSPKPSELIPARTPPQPIKTPSAGSEENEWVRPPPVTR